MKNILLIVLGFLTLASCSCEGCDNTKCKAEVEAKFGEGNVYSLFGEKYEFIAIDDKGNVYYVETKNSGTEISDEQMLFNVEDVEY